MLAFRGIEIIVLALLCSATHGVLDRPIFPAQNGASEGVSQNKNTTIVFDVKNDTQLGKVINFAVNELNKVTVLPYKEQVDEVMEVRANHGNGQLYHMTLRLTKSDCKKENSSCTVSYDTTQYTQVIAALEPPMKPGKEIVVEGEIPSKSKGFDITIQTGYERPIEAQLRISAKFSNEGNVILLKHFGEKVWNLDDHFKGLLETKSTFKVMITCLTKEFTIYLNDKFLTSFPHVEPYEDATHLSVFGEVNITKITGVGPFLPVDKYKPYATWQNDDIKYAESLYVPFVAPLAAPLSFGKNISFKGIVPAYSEWFAISIQSGPEGPPDSVVQMRISPGLPQWTCSPHFANKTSLCHWDGGWQCEDHKQAFTPGRQFHVVITCLRDKFKISIDGKAFATYDLKTPYEKATHVSVDGMVNITEVVGIDKPPKTPLLDAAAGTPYSVSLKELPLSPGRKLKIYAFIPEHAHSFDVFIEGHPGNRIFHVTFAPKTEGGSFYKYTVERNNATHVEDVPGPLCWLKPGQPLEISIKFLENSFLVEFYWQWRDTFEYRLPLNEATRLSFTEDVVIFGVADESGNAPRLLPPTPVLRAPYIVPLENLPLRRGKKILISGFVPLDAVSFYVNLQNGREEIATSIPFHLSFRYEWGYIVWNAHWYEWQKEEKFCQKGCLKRGEAFQLEITCEDGRFHVKYHGVWDKVLAYRLPLDTATDIRIGGNVEIQSVTQTDAESPGIIQPTNQDTPVSKMRVCTMTVLSIWQREMWLNNLVCGADSGRMISGPHIDTSNRR